MPISWLYLVLALAAPPAKPLPVAAPGAMWAVPGLAQVRHRPDGNAERAGTLRRGDAVQVLEVLHDTEGAATWAMLADGFAVAAASLAPLATRPPEVTNAAAVYTYARVIKANAPEFVDHDASSRRRGTQAGARLLAFVPDAALLATGWLRHVGGGYLRLRDLQLLTPSLFAGAHDPKLPLALVRRRTPLRIAGKAAVPQFVSRYDRLALLSARGDWVAVPGGALPRSRVRLAYATPRPAGVPAHGKWLHIDLTEQTLVAHEGDRAVLATLISTGRSPHGTTKGLFRIYAKTVHSTMRGAGPKGYVAEEVPWVMHFFEGEALHGAYWHDQFGIVKSHGCLNLAPADAKWLFAWATPPLPTGWHTRLLGRGEEGVWVEVVAGGQPAPKRLLPRGNKVPTPKPAMPRAQ